MEKKLISRRLLLLTAAAAVAVFVGCSSGDDSNKKAQTETEAAKKKQAGKKQQKPDPNSCVAKGINIQKGRTGTCILNAKRFTLVNRHATLDLKQVKVRFDDIKAAGSLQGPVGVVKPDKGTTFILADLVVTNEHSRPARFNRSGKQVRLRVAGAAFPTAEKAEAVVPTSFFNLNQSIKPGRSQKGTVVFKAKAGVADALEQRGVDPQLLFWNFSTANGKQGPDGAIRLWK